MRAHGARQPPAVQKRKRLRYTRSRGTRRLRRRTPRHGGQHLGSSSDRPAIPRGQSARPRRHGVRLSRGRRGRRSRARAQAVAVAVEAGKAHGGGGAVRGRVQHARAAISPARHRGVRLRSERCRTVLHDGVARWRRSLRSLAAAVARGMRADLRRVLVARVAAFAAVRAPRHHSAQRTLHARRPRQVDRLRHDGAGRAQRVVAGTPAFVAPEIVHRSALDGRADLFSVGATLYHALTRRAPFQARKFGDLVEAWKRRPARPSSYDAQIPAALDALVLEPAQPRSRDAPAQRVRGHAAPVGDCRARPRRGAGFAGVFVDADAGGARGRARRAFLAHRAGQGSPWLCVSAAGRGRARALAHSRRMPARGQSSGRNRAARDRRCGHG